MAGWSGGGVYDGLDGPRRQQWDLGGTAFYLLLPANGASERRDAHEEQILTTHHFIRMFQLINPLNFSN